MLTIGFPNGEMNFENHEEGNKVEVNYLDETGFLSIDAHFQGYSFFLEKLITESYCESELNDRKIILNTETHYESCDIESHSESNPDLHVISAMICFIKDNDMSYNVEITGKAAKQTNEEKANDNDIDNPIEFSLITELVKKPGDWLVELAYGIEIQTIELNENRNDQVNFVLNNISDLSSELDNSLELISLFDRRDGRSIHCYGENNGFIIESSFPLKGKYNSFVLSIKKSKDKNVVNFRPDSVNPEIRVQKNEIFSINDVKNILKFFLINRNIDIDKYSLKKKSYLFKMN